MNKRPILIVFHVFITIFLIYNLHPKAYLVSQNEKQLSSVFIYINDIVRIGIYHTSCIIALWYSHRYASGMIYATGVLLFGEFFQVFAYSIEHLIEHHAFTVAEIVFDVIAIWLFLPALYLTYRFGKEISIYQRDLLKHEMLRTQTNSNLIVDGQGEFSLV